MIEVKIAAKGNKVIDTLVTDEITLKEAALIVYKLEELKLEILKRGFKSDLEVIEE